MPVRDSDSDSTLSASSLRQSGPWAGLGPTVKEVKETSNRIVGIEQSAYRIAKAPFTSTSAPLNEGIRIVPICAATQVAIVVASAAEAHRPNFPRDRECHKNVTDPNWATVLPAAGEVEIGDPRPISDAGMHRERTEGWRQPTVLLKAAGVISSRGKAKRSRWVPRRSKAQVR